MADSVLDEAALNAFPCLEISSGSSLSQQRLHRLMATMLREVREFTTHHTDRIKLQGKIGMALSAERDIDKLLEMIVEESRNLTYADAGTLYIVNDAGSHLDFAILQNDTLAVRQGGTSGKPITLPPVPLAVNDQPNHGNVSAHVAITGQTVNIPDVYQAQGFDFTGPRKYDAATGYRSQSMLVMPLTNHENDIIGVLQLLNAKNPEDGTIIAFHEEYEEMAASLASQAAVALTTAKLVLDLKTLFDAFIKSIATAIDCKSPYTGGHITRVVTLTMMLAQSVNQAADGPYKETYLDQDELEELRLAAWLHDVGKITTPEYMVDKRTKLETVCDRVELVTTRFDLAKSCVTVQNLSDRLALYEQGRATPEALADLEADQAEMLAHLEEDEAFVLDCNSTGEFVSDESLARLQAIASRTFTHNGEKIPLLTENELENLSIRRGSLNSKERTVIERHAVMTQRILDAIPFPKKLARVPFFAAAHHEKINGTGYPNHQKSGAIPLQARILAIADVFEALTATDRPYKKPMSLPEALRILGFMKKDGHIDPDLHDLFVSTGIHEAYMAELERTKGAVPTLNQPADAQTTPAAPVAQVAPGDLSASTSPTAPEAPATPHAPANPTATGTPAAST